MTSPFLTFVEVAAYLRYDLAGPDGAKAADALRKWLAKYGCRPSLKRGLYRLVQIEAAISRLEVAQSRRRHRGFKAHASRFQQPKRTLNSLPVSDQPHRHQLRPVSRLHAGKDEGSESGSRVHSMDGGR